jgi:hypothetical protein
MIRGLLVLLLLGVVGHGKAASGDLALVTAVTGSVSRLVAGNAPRALEPFARLRQGDVLRLDGKAGVRLIFFDSRRQESWQGEGHIEIGGTQGKGMRPGGTAGERTAGTDGQADCQDPVARQSAARRCRQAAQHRNE